MSDTLPLLIRSLRGNEIERPPVWLMRQAGRYLPEYRQLKAEHGFLKMCRTPQLAVQVSLQPVRYLDVDAAIVFSDILIPLSALGIAFDFAPGPIIQNPIRNPDDVCNLELNSVSNHVSYVFDAVSLLKEHLSSECSDPKAVIGFSGAPWTLACYLLHQGTFKTFQGAEVFATRHPDAIHSLLSLLCDLVVEYLTGQIAAGADVVQLFDTWGGNLSKSSYQRLSLPYIKRIIDRLKPYDVPLILYVNHTTHLLSPLKESGADCVSIDQRTMLQTAEKILGNSQALQGNFDPTLLFSSPDMIRQEATNMLRSLDRKSRFIANLGHGVLPETPPENVLTFVQTIKEGWFHG